MVADSIYDSYRTIYATASCDGEIIVGDNYGVISVLSRKTWKKTITKQTSLDCIYSLKYASNCIIVSGYGGIELVEWNGTNFGESKKISSENINCSEVINNKIYSGGEKGHLFVHNLTNGSLLCDIKPHSDTIQCIAASRERNLLASCGEDGLVNIWDLSSENTTPMKILKPFENVDCARKDKFLSALSFKGDWLVTGGGPNTSLWHIGAQEPAQILELPEKTIPNSILHTPTRILLGGSDGLIYQFKNNGKPISKVQSSSAMVYCLMESESGQLFCGGNENSIDIYKHYGYRTHQVQL